MKQLMILLAGLGLSSTIAFSQYILEFNPGRLENNSEVQQSKVNTSHKDAKDETKNDPFTLPQFAGGNKNLHKYVNRHMIYPEIAMEKGIQGKVLIQFMVDKSGNIKNVTVLKSVNPILDAEALKIVSNLPQWEPGKVNGTPAVAYFIIPIEFKIANAEFLAGN